MPHQEGLYFNTPADDKKIWRYMLIDKFMAMIGEKELYFPKIKSFKDKSEGELSGKTIMDVIKRNLLYEDAPIKKDKAFYDQKKWYESLALMNYKEVADVLNSFSFLLQDFSNHLMFCNCWFLKDDESHSMWAEYGEKSPTAIAIQTTIGDLTKTIAPTECRIHIGKIKYINYEKDHITGYEDFLTTDLTNPEKILELFYAPILHKRKIYDDEHEVRAVVSFEFICEQFLSRLYTSKIPFYSDQLFKRDIDIPLERRSETTNLMKDVPKGIRIKIDMNNFIHKVVLSPYANDYFHLQLFRLMEHNGIDPNKLEPSQI